MYDTSTHTDGGLEVSLEVKDDTIRPGGAMTGKVTAVTTAGNAPLKAGTVVLSATDKAKAPLAGLKVGDTVSLDFAFQDERWANVAFSFGRKRHPGPGRPAGRPAGRQPVPQSQPPHRHGLPGR